MAEAAAAAAPPARPPIDAKAAYRELKELFPYVSRTYLRANSKYGVPVMCNHLLDFAGRIPETRGDDTEDEEEREERRRQAEAFLMPAADADADADEEAPPALLVQPLQLPAARQPLPARMPQDPRRRAQQQGAAGDENVDAAPPRKQQRVQQPQPAARLLRLQQQPLQQVPAAVAPPPQQVAAAAAAAGDGAAESDEEEDEEEEEFEMRPIMAGEKCNGGCGKKPRVARVFCEDYLELEGKRHTLCPECLVRRDSISQLRETDDDEPGFVHCPMLRCTHRISMRELAAATRDAAPALHARYTQRVREIAQEARAARRQQQQRQRPLAAVAEEDEDEVVVQQERAGDANMQQQPVLPVTPRPVRRHSATPLLDRRLSQAADAIPSTPRTGRPAPKLSWTPKTRTASVDEEEDDEELPLTEEEAEELRQTAEFVDREKLKQLEGHFPETAVGWLVRHADYGMETLIDMVTKGEADPKLRERADGRGATTIVKTTLAGRKQFECSVCFGDFDEHLAITCVFLPKRRETLLPGEVGPTAAELAKQREEEERGRREQHQFCAECVIGHARAAEEQNVIVRGGVGIKCMEDRCKNALLRAHIEQVLDMQTRAMLDPLLSNEALLAANCHVEKCQKCPYTVSMDANKETQPVFRCPEKDCKHKHCRKCGRTYDDAHKNRTCEDLDPEAVRKRVEEQLTEQSMHKCPRCKRGIVKADGCNKIPCPCGQLSCYVCKKAITDYKHFKNGPAEEKSDKCPLWVDPTKKFEEQRQATLNEQINGATDEAVKEQLRRLV